MIDHDSIVNAASLDEARLQESSQNDALPDAGGTDDLDALLSEYQTQIERAGHAGQSADAPHNGEHVNGDAIDKTLEDAISDAEIAERAQRSRAYYASLQLDQKIQTIKQHEYQKDLKAVVENVRGDMDKTFLKDELVTAWLDARVREDEGLKQAWLGRADNPQMWNAAERVLIKTFRQEYSRLPDPNLTEDRAMVAAALRGAAGPAPVEPPVVWSIENRIKCLFAKRRSVRSMLPVGPMQRR